MGKPAIIQFRNGHGDAKADRNLTGNKGAGLLRMAALDLPVPPGFIIPVSVGQQFIANGGALPDGFSSQLREAMEQLQADLGAKFADEHSPLLVSVRSGAAASMPGMMDTVLNLGINHRTADALIADGLDEHFVWDTFRRFVRSYAEVVLHLPADDFEVILEEARDEAGVDMDAALPLEIMKEVTDAFLAGVESVSGDPFPDDPWEQLTQAVMAVFRSWTSERAVKFRDLHAIAHDGGTAAVVQAMVFGNRDERSATGVYFTRNPSTGEAAAYGEFMVNAQGEEVVSGFRTPQELTEAGRIKSFSDEPSMETLLPETFDELIACGALLEREMCDLQEIEFTVESGRLWLLQSRDGKRSEKAALKIAVDLANAGIITRAQAVERCQLSAGAIKSQRRVAASVSDMPLARGLPASPGIAIGHIAFTSQDAVQAREAGHQVILVRTETDPNDIHGMDAADGILTTRGGMTSHAAVVARGMGKPCITAASGFRIDMEARLIRAPGQTLTTDTILTLDGATGRVFVGEVETEEPQPDGDLATLLSWQADLA